MTQSWKRFLETYEPLFCAAFNARDLDRLTALLLDQAAVEVVGASKIYGVTSARGTVLTGILFGSKRMAAPADGGRGAGNDPRFAQGVLPEPARLELRFHRGEPLLLSWYAHRDGEFVRAVFIVELCGELDLPCRTNGTFRARGNT